MRLHTLERVAKPTLHVDARALDDRGRLAIAPTESDTTRELVGDGVDLALHAFGACSIAEAGRFLERITEVFEARAILRLRGCIEHRPGVTAQGSHHLVVAVVEPEQLRNVQLLLGMTEQHVEVAHALAVTEADGDAAGRKQPDVAFASERDVGGGCSRRSGSRGCKRGALGALGFRSADRG